MTYNSWYAIEPHQTNQTWNDIIAYKKKREKKMTSTKVNIL